jgi:hypothetical protein
MQLFVQPGAAGMQKLASEGETGVFDGHQAETYGKKDREQPARKVTGSHVVIGAREVGLDQFQPLSREDKRHRNATDRDTTACAVSGRAAVTRSICTSAFFRTSHGAPRRVLSKMPYSDEVNSEAQSCNPALRTNTDTISHNIVAAATKAIQNRIKS